eukprot:COSAG03_NODE_60_length_15530_cov_13.458622_5_plen_721_part_00
MSTAAVCACIRGVSCSFIDHSGSSVCDAAVAGGLFQLRFPAVCVKPRWREAVPAAFSSCVCDSAVVGGLFQLRSGATDLGRALPANVSAMARQGVAGRRQSRSIICGALHNGAVVVLIVILTMVWWRCHEVVELLTMPVSFVLVLLALMLSTLWSVEKAPPSAWPLAMWVWYRGRLLIAGPKYEAGGARATIKTPPPAHMWPEGKEPVFPHYKSLQSMSRKAKSKQLANDMLQRHGEDKERWPPLTDLLCLCNDDLARVARRYFPSVVVTDTTLAGMIPTRKWLVHMLSSQRDTRFDTGQNPGIGTGNNQASHGNNHVEHGVLYNGKRYSSVEWQQYALKEGMAEFNALMTFETAAAVFAHTECAFALAEYKTVVGFGLQSEALAMAVVVRLMATAGVKCAWSCTRSLNDDQSLPQDNDSSADDDVSPLSSDKSFDLRATLAGMDVLAFLGVLGLDADEAQALVQLRGWDTTSPQDVQIRFEMKASDALVYRDRTVNRYKFEANSVDKDKFDLLVCSLWHAQSCLLCVSSVKNITVGQSGCLNSRTKGARVVQDVLSDEDVLRFFAFHGSWVENNTGWTPIALLRKVQPRGMWDVAMLAKANAEKQVAIEQALTLTKQMLKVLSDATQMEQATMPEQQQHQPTVEQQQPTIEQQQPASEQLAAGSQAAATGATTELAVAQVSRSVRRRPTANNCCAVAPRQKKRRGAAAATWSERMSDDY